MSIFLQSNTPALFTSIEGVLHSHGLEFVSKDKLAEFVEQINQQYKAPSDKTVFGDIERTIYDEDLSQFPPAHGSVPNCETLTIFTLLKEELSVNRDGRNGLPPSLRYYGRNHGKLEPLLQRLEMLLWEGKMKTEAAGWLFAMYNQPFSRPMIFITDVNKIQDYPMPYPSDAESGAVAHAGRGFFSMGEPPQFRRWNGPDQQ